LFLNSLNIYGDRCNCFLFYMVTKIKFKKLTREFNSYNILVTLEVLTTLLLCLLLWRNSYVALGARYDWHFHRNFCKQNTSSSPMLWTQSPVSEGNVVLST